MRNLHFFGLDSGYIRFKKNIDTAME